MKKDKYIKNKLNEYIDSIKPPYGIIYDAVYVLRNSRARPSVRPFAAKWIYMTAAALALIVIFFIGAISLINARVDGNVNINVEYNLAGLGKKSIEFSEVSQINSNILMFDYTDMDTECNLFFDRKTEKAVMVAVKYKILGSSGTDEVFVIADIKKGLKDLEEYKNLPQIKSDDVNINLTEFYKNGEFYTNAYFEKDDIDYYIIVMSPAQGQGEEYLEKLLI